MPELVFDSISQLVMACLVLMIAEGVYVLLGFGSGLIAVGVLAMVFPEIQDVVVLLLLINLPAETWVVWSSWREIQWRGVLLIAAGLAVGVPIGTWTLKLAEPAFVLTVLGVFLVAAGAAFLAAPQGRLRHVPTWVSVPVGAVSGVLGGLFGTGGPPLIFYYQLRGIEKAVFRGNLMAIFLLVTFVRVPSYAFAGLITGPRLASAAVVLPAVLLGTWIGHRVHLELDESTFRRLVSIVLILIGVMLLLRQVL